MKAAMQGPRPWQHWAGGVVVTLALAAGLLLLARHQGATAGWAQVVTLPPLAWGLALAGLAASYGLRAKRLQAEWAPRLHLPWREALRITCTHTAAVNLLPLRAGELGFPWLLHRHAGVALGDAASSLLWMRLQDAIVTAWLAAVSLAAVGAAQADWPWWLALALAVLATAAFLALAGHLGRWATAAQGRWGRMGGETGPATGAGRWRQRLQSWAGALAQAGGRASPATWAWCLANWLLKLTTLAGLLAALTHTPPLAAWAGALAGEAAAALPVQPPAGFGTYEATVAWVLGRVAPTPWPPLLSAALAVHLLVMASAVGAAACCWVWLGHGARPQNLGSPAHGTITPLKEPA